MPAIAKTRLTGFSPGWSACPLNSQKRWTLPLRLSTRPVRATDMAHHEPRPFYVIRTADGSPLGRMDLTSPLGPVPEPFAYTYPTVAEAEMDAVTYDGPTTVVPGV
jgi:hypothetical protein